MDQPVQPYTPTYPFPPGHFNNRGSWLELNKDRPPQPGENVNVTVTNLDIETKSRLPKVRYYITPEGVEYDWRKEMYDFMYTYLELDENISVFLETTDETVIKETMLPLIDFDGNPIKNARPQTDGPTREDTDTDEPMREDTADQFPVDYTTGSFYPCEEYNCDMSQPFEKCYRKAALRLHPDKGGSEEDFKKLGHAKSAYEERGLYKTTPCGTRQRFS